MKRFLNATVSLFLIIVFSVQVCANENVGIDNLIKSTGNYLYETVREPTVGSIGGEWAILGLARSGMDIPDEYFESYYRNVEQYVKDRNGVLHTKKYTEYSRVILALTAIGKNPADVATHNLLTPLGDYEKTVFQGINGAIWALIALDSGDYDIPVNQSAKVQATRETFVNTILEKQLSDGGFALTGDKSDADVTAMALQALSKYQNNAKVKSATEKALTCLSKMQNANGGFSTYGEETAESCVQVIVALCELGIAIDDSRFVKNGNTVLDGLLAFYDGKNAFKHTKDGETNQMATEQCFYALVSLKRINECKNSLFNMSDAKAPGGADLSVLPGKHPDVKKLPVIHIGKTFDDIKNIPHRLQIEALASRGIINGKTDQTFEPDSTMTRAEFATAITRALGLPIKGKQVFNDVKSNHWFYSYVSTAYSYGIINGVSKTEFNPGGTINRQEASAMVARAAKLCGHDTTLSTSEIRNILAGFSDYVKASEWSREALAFCYSKGILDDSVLKINPMESVTRAEIAYMIYNMLDASNLL